MNTKKIALMGLCLAAFLCGGHGLQRSVATEIVSVGSATDTVTGSVQNVGQTAIGYTTNGTTQMYLGGIYVLFDTSCLKGDVDNNGLINGDDIDNYVQVILTGMGTTHELCAADVDVPAFVALLLE